MLSAAVAGLVILTSSGDVQAQGFIDDSEDPVPLEGIVVAGVHFPDSILLNHVSLQLAGAGARKKSRLVMYSMGYYVNDIVRPVHELIDADEPALIRMEAVSTLITPARFAKAVRRGFERSAKGTLEEIEAQIGPFLESVKEPLKRGEVLDLAYIPGVGTRMLRNGETQTTVAGLEFKQALFRIWLGDDPIDEQLKEDLLAGFGQALKQVPEEQSAAAADGN
jgi:hypothetical protein